MSQEALWLGSSRGAIRGQPERIDRQACAAGGACDLLVRETGHHAG